MISDSVSRHHALRATGRLAAFNAADVLDAADVHVATRLGELAGEPDGDVRLAVGLAVRAARLGAVCVSLAEVAKEPFEVDTPLDWPEPEAWSARVAASPLVAAGVIRLEGAVLYLDRHWREEKLVCEELLGRLSRPAPVVDDALLNDAARRLFPEGWQEQRVAAIAATRHWTTVLTGGPGTGKTASVARLLAMVCEQHQSARGTRPRVALAAPTGKASTRLQESVAREARDLDETDRDRLAGLTAVTLHRLLGWRPDSSTRFRHDRSQPLPYDVIVVDEVSMVSLSMMCRLLEAVRPTTRLVLVGDADQLASVEAGAVLADLVRGLETRTPSPVVRLTLTHRTTDAGEGNQLDRLAAALRAGDPDEVLAVLRGGSAAVRLVDPDDEAAMAAVRTSVVNAAQAVMVAAAGGDGEQATALLEEHRLLCAHREGRFGVGGWNRLVARMLAERNQVAHYDEWYVGRPVLVTANDRGLGLSNGDLGVTVRGPDDRLRVAVRIGHQVRPYAPTRLSGVDTVYAMTVHKSQGSEAQAVTVVLPPEESPLLTRELFYTAVTRARRSVTVVGSEAAIRVSVEREVRRASGLARRLGGH